MNYSVCVYIYTPPQQKNNKKQSYSNYHKASALNPNPFNGGSLDLCGVLDFTVPRGVHIPDPREDPKRRSLNALKGFL